MDDEMIDAGAFAVLVGMPPALARHRIEVDGLAATTRDGEPMVRRTVAEAFKVRRDAVGEALAEVYATCMDAEDATAGGEAPAP